MPHYRLIAIDIDGTLLDSHSQLRPTVRAALRHADEAGVHVLLCTGRRYRSALPVAQDAGLPLPLVCHSGALVKDTGSHHTLHATTLTSAALGALLDALADEGLAAFAYTDTYERGHDFAVERDASLTRFHEDYLAKNSGCFVEVDSLRGDLGTDVVQVCTFAELDELRNIKQRLGEMLAGLVTCHLLSAPAYIGHFLEFQSRDASKWAAITTLAAGYDVALGQVVAIGDNENDISMIRAAGLGVAMGNAHYAVKSAADVVAASNDEDGVARIIDKIIEG